MGCASSAPSEGSTSAVAGSDSSRGSMLDALEMRTQKVRASFVNPAESGRGNQSLNFLDFLAEQMGEGGKAEDGAGSIADRFKELFQLVFKTEWVEASMSPRKVKKLDKAVLEQLQGCFQAAPKMSLDMVRWKYEFKYWTTPAKGVSLEAKGKTGVHFERCTLVHAFCALGLIKSLRFVLDNSSLVATPKRSRKVSFHTPFETAVRFNHVGLAKMLVDEYGVDPLESFVEPLADRATKKHCALLRAVADGRLEATKFMLELGADATELFPRPEYHMHTSLLRLTIARALNDYQEVAKLLLTVQVHHEHGLVAVNRHGNVERIHESPVMTATMVGDLVLLSLLVEKYGADTSRHHTNGNSNLLALAAGVPDNTEVLSYLLENTPLDPLEANSAGVSALTVAKDTIPQDNGANAKVLNKASKRFYKRPARPKVILEHDCLAPQDDDESPVNASGLSIGDRVLVAVDYSKHRRLRSGLQSREYFWCKVSQTHASDVDVEIDDVLGIAHGKLGANFGDVISSVPLNKIHETRGKSDGHPDDVEDVAEFGRLYTHSQ